MRYKVYIIPTPSEIKEGPLTIWNVDFYGGVWSNIDSIQEWAYDYFTTLEDSELIELTKITGDKRLQVVGSNMYFVREDSKLFNHMVYMEEVAYLAYTKRSRTHKARQDTLKLTNTVYQFLQETIKDEMETA